MFKILRKIANEIYEEEKKEHNLEGEILPVTIIDYYKYNLYDKKLKLFKEYKSLKSWRGWSGYYNGEQIFIKLSHTHRLEGPCRNIVDFVEVCYHEIRHEIQDQFDIFSYERILYDFGGILRSVAPKDYRKEHCKYSMEIGAHLYGINKAEQYLKENYPHYYKECKDVIEQKKKSYLFDYMTYDASNAFDIAIDVAKKCNYEFEIINEENINSKEKENDKRITYVVKKEETKDKIWFLIFLNKDFSMKPLSEIIKHKNFHKIDKRIVYAILSSRNFLESVNFDELSEEELNLILESLQYTNTVYQNQLKWLEQETSIKLVDKLKAERNIWKQYQITCNYIEQKIKHKLNKARSDKRQQQHKESIPEYIEKTNDLIRKRTNRGYITINIFYIIGLILSVITIIYLMIDKAR